METVRCLNFDGVPQLVDVRRQPARVLPQPVPAVHVQQQRLCDVRPRRPGANYGCSDGRMTGWGVYG
jgi:hypothetical protein